MENKIAELRKIRVQEDQRYVLDDMSISLRARLEELWEHAKDCVQGGGSRRRQFAVIGESGTGKSTSMKHALRSMDELQPRLNEYNEPVIPYVSMPIPRTCTTKDLALHLLHRLGQTHITKGNEDDLYEALKEQLPKSETLILHFDESQHLLKSGSDTAVKGLQDRFKSLLNIEEWPVHLVLSGEGDLTPLFLGPDRQLPNRSAVMRFEPLRFPADKDRVSHLLNNIVVENLRLKLDPELMTNDFLGRLVHATGGEKGTMIEMIRAATYKAMSKDHEQVTARDFAWFYARTSGCLVDDNIFTSPEWRKIDRNSALADLAPPAPVRKTRRKASK